MSDQPRPSRRRAVAVAGHTGDEATARAHLDDPDARVRATALGALDRLGALDDGTLGRSLADGAAEVRRRAATLAATRPAVGVVALLADPDPAVVEAAAWAAGEQDPPDPSAAPGLADVATHHDDPLCREAAVAALGALADRGDARGRAAVLGALADRPAVRRRAVLALAAFDGEEVDAGLRAALDDRDWQVREAAAALVEPGAGEAGVSSASP